MRAVVFGLSVTSSWGNGHATLWRGLGRALRALGHSIVFFERDEPYYAAHRDPPEAWGCQVRLYRAWSDIAHKAEEEVRAADAAIVTSYCPDAIDATETVISHTPGTRVFYDLDTPVTLHAIRHGNRVAYLGPRGLSDFDVVLSFTGGAALAELCERLGARRAVPLYGSVDPDVHHPVPQTPANRALGSYLGTYAADRQAMLRELFLLPAAEYPDERFLLAGAQYPPDYPWRPNLWHIPHLAPSEHPSFLCSSRLTVNVTRSAMAEMGYCPSGRLFEAAACGVPILSDSWRGLDEFFAPGSEILIARNAAEAIDAFRTPPDELDRVARRARERVLDHHTAMHRARQLVAALESSATAVPNAERPETATNHKSGRGV